MSNFILARLKHLAALGLFLMVVSLGLGSQPTLAEDEETLSLNFRNVDISQFIESVSTLTGKNFLVDRRVTGRITIIAAQPIPRDSLYDVMLSILQFYGFTAIPDGDIVKVIPFAEGLSLPPSDVDDLRHGFVTEIIKINTISAGEVIKVVKPMLTRQAQIVAITVGNSVLISDTQAAIARAKQVIARLDSAEIDEYEIISLSNANVDTIIATINAIFKANNPAVALKLQADKRTNRLIISGSNDVRSRVKELITQLDVPISTNANIKVVYLRYADAQNLANILTRLTSSEAFEAIASQQNNGQPGAAAPTPAQQPATAQQPAAPTQQDAATGGEVKSGIQADTGLNALIISGSGNFISAVESIIRQLDIQKPQILIEVIIAELTDDLTRELGVDWAVSGSAGAFITNLGPGLPTAASSALAGNSANLITSAPTGGLVAGAASGTTTNGWSALLRLLNTDQRSNVVATPYLVTLDNEEATFTVGENRPFVTGEVRSDTGQTTTTVERRNVGITLVVTPQVTAGDTVQLAINQEISNAVSNAAESEGLITTERKITTNVQVRDGGLIVLGGLKQSIQVENRAKVPGLGDIPYAGALFRNQRSELTNANIMIFMRPRVLHDESAIASLSHGKYNSLRQQQVDLPQYDSLIGKARFPQLKDLRENSLFTDYGKPRTIDSLLKNGD